ncbi:general stress protein [Komagataeibacter diospyri]|uniref:Uncharacterized protein n=1 Tax=Komagataeibacter diospyri TaxID=1932662 RepID=A0A4P5NP92_9PROT|nr:hypothetical protein [Komagataeibacter diospyri]GCE82277.1 hypothetical protein MSKU9_0418 [Komagataeibacter diospyri]
MVYRINLHERTSIITMASVGTCGGATHNPGNFYENPQRTAKAGQKDACMTTSAHT